MRVKRKMDDDVSWLCARINRMSRMTRITRLLRTVLFLCGRFAEGNGTIPACPRVRLERGEIERKNVCEWD